MKVSRRRTRSAATVFAVAILAMLPARSSSASLLEIVPSSPTLLPGASETVSVVLTATQNFPLTAADIEIAFDSARFAVSNVVLGSLDTGNGFDIVTGINNGMVQSSITTNTAGNSITSGQTGTIETFTLTALANAPLGGNLGNINLLASIGRVRTDVFTDPTTSGAIVLSPAPTNGYDAGVDGTVLVGSAVPEPSSVILMGLGGGLVTLTSLLRKRARRSAIA